eukprot:c43413_g1_i1 orf=47-586(+)
MAARASSCLQWLPARQRRRRRMDSAMDCSNPAPRQSLLPHALFFQHRILLSCYVSRGGIFSAAKWRGGMSVNCSGGQVDPDNSPEQNGNEKGSVDWDKAWSRFSKEKRSIFSKFDFDKFVTRTPRYPNYPISEEVDPFKRIERSTLRFWTDTKFTIAGFGVIVALFIYMVIIVGAPPSK